MRTTAACLLLLALSSCSFLETDQELDRVEITNATGEPLWVRAFHHDLTTTPMDPIPEFELDEVPFPRIAGGATLVLDPSEVQGFATGSSVSLFVYARREAVQDDGSYKPYASFVLFIKVPHEELVDRDGRIVVRDLAW